VGCCEATDSCSGSTVSREIGRVISPCTRRSSRWRKATHNARPVESESCSYFQLKTTFREHSCQYKSVMMTLWNLSRFCKSQREASYHCRKPQQRHRGKPRSTYLERIIITPSAFVHDAGTTAFTSHGCEAVVFFLMTSCPPPPKPLQRQQ
jgi:hypothetical protein